MVDIHCHILPALDDGAKSFDEAVAMVKMASAAGTTDVVATPHANHEYPFCSEQVALKISELLDATDNVLNIHSGCDFHLSAANIGDALSNPTKYAINHRTYVLVEFSDYVIPPSAAEIFDQMRAVGMIPIITHPERNHLLYEHVDQIRSWIQHGCYTQVTSQSFLGRFGKSAKAFTDRLMACGLVHFVASDGHNTIDRPPVLTPAYEHVAETYGEACAQALFVTNPKATLTGEPIQQVVVSRKKRKWFDLSRTVC